jgi:hypothetical protein
MLQALPVSKETIRSTRSGVSLLRKPIPFGNLHLFIALKRRRQFANGAFEHGMHQIRRNFRQRRQHKPPFMQPRMR